MVAFQKFTTKIMMIVFFHFLGMSGFIHASESSFSIRSAEELMTDMSGIFRLMQNSPQCEEKLNAEASRSRNRAIYCENLEQIACATQPNPRRDRTGGVYTHENARQYMEVPDQTFEPFSASLMGYINGRIQRTVAERPQIYQRIFQSEDPALHQRCAKKIFFAFLRINRHQFSATGQQYAANRQEAHFDYASINSEDLRQDEMERFLGAECAIKDRNSLISFMTSRTVRDFRKEVDERVLRNFENTPIMQRIRTKIFPDVKAAAIRLIQQSNSIGVDPNTGRPSPRQSAIKAELIRRIGNTELAACDRLGQRAFGRTMSSRPDRTGELNEITICPLDLAQCQSEFCIVQGLAHELIHSIDACTYEDSVYKPDAAIGQSELEKNHPLGSLIRCTRLNIGTPELMPDQNICQHRHLNESLADQGGNFIMAEYFATNSSGYAPPLSTTDYLRGFANASMCRDRISENYEMNRYPGDRQRVQILINNPRVRELMNCPARRSTSQKPVCQF